jgi:sarcosine oxidase subunit beta
MSPSSSPTTASDLPTSAAIVIIGGGVMGASIAYHLAKRGQRDVLLLEREAFFGQGATGRCAGGMRYQFSTEINIQLSLHSLPMLEHFAEETGQPIDIRRCGYLLMATQDEDVAAFKRNVELQHRFGVMTEWWDGDDVRKRLPMMNLGDVIAATFHGKDGLADPNGVVMGYVNAARRLGAKLINDALVTGIEIRNDKVCGVVTTKGHVSTPIVVNAAGPWAAEIGKMAGLDLPIAPVRRQWMSTTPLPEIPSDFPFVIDFAQSLYFHREGDGLLTGMSNPNEQPGNDQSVDEDWELIAIEAAIKRMPLLERAGRAAHMAGLYEVTPDAHPILGNTPVEGFYVCAGFSGHGFMHGPISGLLLAEEILDGRAATIDIDPLRLSRFAEQRTLEEYNVI